MTRAFSDGLRERVVAAVWGQSELPGVTKKFDIAVSANLLKNLG